MDPFEVLGVSESSSLEDIERAYKRLAKIYHPDRYAAAGDDVRREAESRMMDLNQAWQAIKSGNVSPEGRIQTDSERAAREAIRRTQEFEGSFCFICGHGPATTVTLRSGVGRLLSRTVRTWHGDLCRSCGLAMFREAQNDTLIKGWWGVSAFFANIVYVFGNVGQRRKLWVAPTPRPTPVTVLTPLSSPLGSEPDLFKRSGVYVAAFVLFIVAVAVGGYLSEQQTSDVRLPPPPAGSYLPPDSSSGGSLDDGARCGLVAGSFMETTPCSSYHTHRMEKQVFSKSSCPYGTEYTTRDGTMVECWVPDY